MLNYIVYECYMVLALKIFTHLKFFFNEQVFLVFVVVYGFISFCMHLVVARSCMNY